MKGMEMAAPYPLLPPTVDIAEGRPRPTGWRPARTHDFPWRHLRAMERGDTIQTLRNGVPGPQHVVLPAELTLRTIQMLFDRETLQGLGTDHVSLSYIVSDHAGNESILSMALVMSLTR